MRIRDWSSDVCSSDLSSRPHKPPPETGAYPRRAPADAQPTDNRSYPGSDAGTRSADPGAARGRPEAPGPLPVRPRPAPAPWVRDPVAAVRPWSYRFSRSCGSEASRGTENSKKLAELMQPVERPEENTSELQSLMRISY